MNKIRLVRQPGTVTTIVRAYPIRGQLKGSTGTLSSLQIVKLTQVGFLAEAEPTGTQPGDVFDVVFEIPVLHKLVSERVKVVKLYHRKIAKGLSNQAEVGGHEHLDLEDEEQNQAQPQEAPAALESMHLVEFHFVDLTLNGRERIVAFLRTIDKKKK